MSFCQGQRRKVSSLENCTRPSKVEPTLRCLNCQISAHCAPSKKPRIHSIQRQGLSYIEVLSPCVNSLQQQQQQPSTTLRIRMSYAQAAQKGPKQSPEEVSHLLLFCTVLELTWYRRKLIEAMTPFTLYDLYTANRVNIPPPRSLNYHLLAQQFISKSPYQH